MSHNARRVVVADDDGHVLSALMALLGDEPDIEVVSGAVDGDDTITACLAHRPDVLVVDVNMPNGGGERATRTLSAALPALRIVAISANSDSFTRRRMADAGATAFVAKSSLGNLIPEVLGPINPPADR